MHKGLLTFTKLSYHYYAPYDVRCVEEFHKITLESESEEDLLENQADYVNFHQFDLPSNSKFETVDVEIINQSFVIL